MSSFRACSSCTGCILMTSRPGSSGRWMASDRCWPGHGGDVELLGIDAAAGAVHLNLLGSCHGCPSSTVTLRMAVETAIAEAAPEIFIIDVELPTEDAPPVGEPVPITLGAKKPVYEECPGGIGPTMTSFEG